MKTIKITGTGSALPERIVTNFELEQLVDTSEEWIRERTGISARHISTGESVADMAAAAAAKAMESAGKSVQEVELILVATCSPEMLLPCCACQVQRIIGADNAVAFDINAACSGFVFALSTAYSYMQAGMYKNALIIGSEVLSKLVDWTDRSTCVLFGDGAGAAFVEIQEERQENASGIIGILQGSDGAGGMVLSCYDRPICNPYTVPNEKSGYVKMDGQAVYKFAVKQVAVCIQETLQKVDMDISEVDLFVLHQANIRIIEGVAKRLQADIGKFPANLHKVGNMSSATIPVLLDELNRSGKLKRGDKVVLAGFGAGLTYGACVIIW